MQKYNELSWIKEALDYADKKGTDKQAAKIIKRLVDQADFYRTAMYGWQCRVAKIKKCLDEPRK